MSLVLFICFLFTVFLEWHFIGLLRSSCELFLFLVTIYTSTFLLTSVYCCRYRLRSKVEIENVTQDFSCWQRFSGKLAEKSKDTEEPEAASVGWGPGVDHSAMSASRGNDVGWQWFKDPRLDCLGFRGIFPSNKMRTFSNPLLLVTCDIFA